MAFVSTPLAPAAVQHRPMCLDMPCSPAPVATAPRAQPAGAAWHAVADAGGQGPAALLVQASEGVCIVRHGVVMPALAGGMLELGDRIVVPAAGRAQAVFQEQDDQVLLGSFDGGTDASLAYFSRKQGACSVVFDLVAGHVDMALSTLEGAERATPSVVPGRRAIGFYCYSQAIAGR